MKKYLSILVLLVPFFQLSAQALKMESKALMVSLSADGYYERIRIGAEEVLDSQVRIPIVTACHNGNLIVPVHLKSSGRRITLTMTDGKILKLQYKETPHCITLQTTEVPNDYDALLFGPVRVNIHDVVGEVVGVVQGRGVAMGMQALNQKTISGIPNEYIDVIKTAFKLESKPSELSVESVPFYRHAAINLSDGAAFQLAVRNRSRLEKRMVQNLEGSLVLPVEGPDALLIGAKIAMFGCNADEALHRVGEVEQEQGLPHPVLDGEWGKTSRSSMDSYLITAFGEDNLDFVLDKAEKAGFKYIYHPGPFETWGHFQWSENFTKTGDNGVKAMVDKAAARGMKMGVHTLSNFITTNDSYVTPTPSEHLLKQGTLILAEDIDASQTTLHIKSSHLFKVPLTLNTLMIGKEIITYGKMNETEGQMTLTSCKRGAFGTHASAHNTQEPLYKLWDYPYRTLFPDMSLQDKIADRLVEIYNNTGLSQISFDGIEGCMWTGQDDYATTRFVNQFYKGLKHNVLNDASRMNHFTWHIHTRMNWGEPWGEAMRTGQVENRIKNQAYFQRNLFPRMLGWFLIRLADRKFECSTLEDLEWALSESAGFDAGYAMTISPKTLHRHGDIDTMLEAIYNWDKLRKNKCFTQDQMNRLKDPITEWHLEKVNEEEYKLYPLSISKHFNCSLGELQPGQPGGADWIVGTPYGGKFSFRLRVEWEGYIENPQFITEKGTILFPCRVEQGQYLIYKTDGTACVTDRNYNTIKTITPDGHAELPKGGSHVVFSCERDGETEPDIQVRFITYGEPEIINYKF